MGLSFQNVDFSYLNKKDIKQCVLHDINLNINAEDEFVFILGQTGSGKSTLAQLSNALLTPTKGTIKVFDQVVLPKKNTNLRGVRKRVGLVFQFPEYQLFEDTVIKDVMFGPKNYGAKSDEAKRLAIDALEKVGVTEDLYERTPFTLSGGQMRKVAIAGVIACNPDILILDEPTVGLDDVSKNDLMNTLVEIQKATHKSIVIITHNMNVVAAYGKRVIVLDKGDIVFDGTPLQLFNDSKVLNRHHLDLPDISKLAVKLKENGKINFNKIPLSVDELFSLSAKESVKNDE